ncbi:MAG: hypothetical protein JWQ62_1248 [Lacunisphaera sp.]|nr:hypothetical protein [Lacunisphaera sp.]
MAFATTQRLQTWMQAELVHPAESRVFAHACIHALHSMAMVELLSGDDEDFTTPSRDMQAFVDLFWERTEAGEARSPLTARNGAAGPVEADDLQARIAGRRQGMRQRLGPI